MGSLNSPLEKFLRTLPFKKISKKSLINPGILKFFQQRITHPLKISPNQSPKKGK